jgi:RNA polymerase sigma factor (sigma-70 family)
MPTDNVASLRKVSVAAYAAAIAASVGLAHAPGQPEARTIDQVERYCATSWRNAGIHPQDWSDCTQEAIVRLLERVPQSRLDAALHDEETPERRELKRAVWRTIQRWRRAPRCGSIDGELVSDPDVAVESADLRDALDAGLRQLSPRQQLIVSWWSEGYTIHEIALELGIPAARVSDEKYKAIRKLQRWLA